MSNSSESSMDMDDMEALQLGDAENKERRFSVHDVVEEDNNVNYGQPDNQAVAEDNISRITSVDDDDDQKKSTRVYSSSIHSDSHEDDNANVYIHENLDDNDEYANEHIINENQYNEDIHDAEQGGNSGPNDIESDNKDNISQKDNHKGGGGGDKVTDDNNNNNNDNKETYPSHYRHPSLAADEQPASDDDDVDKEHGRYLSTIIREGVDSLVFYISIC